MRTKSKFEAMGKKLAVITYDGATPTYRRDGSRLSYLSLSVDLVDRPEWGADDTEWKARHRAELAIAKPIIEAALALVGVDSKFSFSAKRLCKCGCSPAFILDQPVNATFEIVEVRQ